MAIRVKETPMVERRWLMMKCSFKMSKQTRITFTMVTMEMKIGLTMVRFLPPMENKMPSTGEPVLPKTSSAAEIE